MSQEFIITFSRQAIFLAAELAAPILLVALIVGLLVSIFQAVTQIQEMTLAIIPKMMGVLIVIIILLPWFLSKLTTFMSKVLINIPVFIGIAT
ncbi:MAG: flagellar biosynthetic protein FliQ [bacterium]